MRTVWTALCLTLVVNLLLLIGLFGYLYMSDRLDQQRFRAAVDLFRLTINEEREIEAGEYRVAEEKQREIEKISRLQVTGKRSMTLAERLDAQTKMDDMAMARFHRMGRVESDLKSYFQRMKYNVEKQRVQLEADRKAFHDVLDQEKQLRDDNDFKQAVNMYQQIRPKQVKEMFQQLIDQNKTDEVVKYLAAMQLRKAAKVLEAFKDGDVAQAANLIERLRNRGINPLVGLAQIDGGSS